MSKTEKKRVRFLILNKADNVALALEKIERGTILEIDRTRLKVKDSIEFGHKFALKQINKGERIIKGGETIGEAIRDIQMGEHVHIHNIISLRARRQNEKI